MVAKRIAWWKIEKSRSLQQVIWNLLSNAVKFTPNGEKVDIRLTQVDNHTQIEIIDTGKGINPEFLPYIFEHFRQEDGATTRKFGGLGLGLAIARQIVELHGGQIGVESGGINRGATFTVQFPLLRVDSSQIPDKEMAFPVPSSNTIPLANVRALVVDDDVDAREFLAFLLRQSGATVTVTASALEACKRWNKAALIF
jgi:Histidine kinase-, DNA gyrase B-, and HSP90-like ATPase